MKCRRFCYSLLSVRAAMEKRLEFVSALGCANPIESSSTIYMGRRRVHIGDHDRAFSYVLRPDIKAENVLGLLEQVSIIPHVLH
jgi:hypothetical protein